MIAFSSLTRKGGPTNAKIANAPIEALRREIASLRLQ
jgi:hypothetical protein